MSREPHRANPKRISCQALFTARYFDNTYVYLRYSLWISKVPMWRSQGVFYAWFRELWALTRLSQTIYLRRFVADNLHPWQWLL